MCEIHGFAIELTVVEGLLTASLSGRWEGGAKTREMYETASTMEESSDIMVDIGKK